MSKEFRSSERPKTGSALFSTFRFDITFENRKIVKALRSFLIFAYRYVLWPFFTDHQFAVLPTKLTLP